MKKVLISIFLLSAALLPVAMASAQANIPEVSSLDQLFDAIKNAAVGILGIIVFASSFLAGNILFFSIFKKRVIYFLMRQTTVDFWRQRSIINQA